MSSRRPWSPRRLVVASRLASRLAILGTALAVLSGLVTLRGQIASYGGPLPAFLGVEAVTLAVLLLAVLALHRSGRRWRRLGELISALAGLWSLLTAAGMVLELFSGLAPSWLPLDAALSALTGAAWAAAAVLGWNEDRAGAAAAGGRA